jgi:hypothetical protein
MAGTLIANMLGVHREGVFPSLSEGLHSCVRRFRKRHGATGSLCARSRLLAPIDGTELLVSEQGVTQADGRDSLM